MSPDRLWALVRTLALAGVFQAAGAAFFLLLFGPWLARAGHRIRRLGCYAALAGLLLLAAQQWLQGARMADGYDGLFDPALQRLAWGGSGGHAALLQMFGLAVIACALTRAGRAAAGAASSGALIAAPKLTPGSYTLSYRVVSDDSHIMSGSIKFRLREP